MRRCTISALKNLQVNYIRLWRGFSWDAHHTGRRCTIVASSVVLKQQDGHVERSRIARGVQLPTPQHGYTLHDALNSVRSTRCTQLGALYSVRCIPYLRTHALANILQYVVQYPTTKNLDSGCPCGQVLALAAIAPSAVVTGTPVLATASMRDPVAGTWAVSPECVLLASSARAASDADRVASGLFPHLGVTQGSESGHSMAWKPRHNAFLLLRGVVQAGLPSAVLAGFTMPEAGMRCQICDCVLY